MPSKKKKLKVSMDQPISDNLDLSGDDEWSGKRIRGFNYIKSKGKFKIKRKG